MQRFSWASRFLGASTFVNNLFLNTVHATEHFFHQKKIEKNSGAIANNKYV